MICPYCKAPVILQDSILVYRSKSYGPMWICSSYPKCDAYVGCHPGTENPLGTPANAELRRWRNKAHAIFDPLFLTKKMSRTQAYKFMAKIMCLTKKEAHIGKFSIEQCKELIEKISGQTKIEF